MTAGKLLRPILTFAIFALGLAIPATAVADTFTVTNGGSSGSGSLRQAVLDANAHPGHDAIDFASSVKQILVSTAPGQDALAVTGDLDIVGPGAPDLHVLGLDSRVFDVKEGATVTVSGMSIERCVFDNGALGGAILNAGTLALDGVALENNRASDPSGGDVRGGAIANSGTLAMKNSVLSENSASGSLPGAVSGGAVFNSGTMTIDGSRLTGNGAGSADAAPDGGDARGGAIANTGDLRISDSTLSSNLARGGNGHLQGGAGLGGAVYNYADGTLRISRSTLAHNKAWGGGASVGGGGVGGLAIGGGIENVGSASFHLDNVTLSANDATAFDGHRETQSFGGGIDNQSPFTARSSVLASTMSGNSAFEGSNVAISSANLTLQDTILANPVTQEHTAGRNCGHPRGVPSLPPIASLGYNLDSDGSCELKGTGDQADKDPQLGDLADNGGPTQTMAIPLSSPALDQGVSGGLTTDQRGEKRPVIVPGVPRPEGGDGSDIGAYEYQPAPRGHLRIKGSVEPGRAPVGERTCFEFKAKHPNGGPMKKAQVKLAGKRARTDERGKATICKRFKDSGVRHPRIRKRGHERAKLRVNVRP